MGETSEDHERDRTQLFLRFHYPEVKDLSKHFITLISASLVFSVAFSDKIVEFRSAPIIQQVTLFLSWLLLIFALCASGFGLYLIFIAAEKASGSIIYEYKSDYRTLARRSYAFLDIAGIAFGSGLILLTITAFINFFI